MFVRGLCCALVALFASSAAAEVLVQDGDYFPELWVWQDTLQMTGGVVEKATLSAKQLTDEHTISGGELGVKYKAALDLEAGMLNVRGGQWNNGVFRGRDASRSTINLYGYYFRYEDGGRREHNAYLMEGILEDGSFFSFTISNLIDYRTEELPINFIVLPSELPAGDVNGDWTVDLFDLNTVRNNFGSAGTRAEGDMDGNGVVDLADLNATRNNFGYGNFSLQLWSEHTIEVKESASVAPNTDGPFFSVPEPSAMLLALPCFSTCLGILLRCRRSPGPRRRSASC